MKYGNRNDWRKKEANENFLLIPERNTFKTRECCRILNSFIKYFNLTQKYERRRKNSTNKFWVGVFVNVIFLVQKSVKVMNRFRIGTIYDLFVHFETQ